MGGAFGSRLNLDAPSISRYTKGLTSAPSLSYAHCHPSFTKQICLGEDLIIHLCAPDHLDDLNVLLPPPLDIQCLTWFCQPKDTRPTRLGFGREVFPQSAVPTGQVLPLCGGYDIAGALAWNIGSRGQKDHAARKDNSTNRPRCPCSPWSPRLLTASSATITRGTMPGHQLRYLPDRGRSRKELPSRRSAR